MSTKFRERRLNVDRYTLLVRDFLDENTTPVEAEIRVFDREGQELTNLYRKVSRKDRVETINELKIAIRDHKKSRKSR